MTSYANPQLLCSVEELGMLAAGPEPPLLLDLRPAEAFAVGHLPRAVHLDLYGLSLIDTSPGPLRAFLWMIEHLLMARGVSDGPVIVYDENSGIRAARAFWFLEYFGHEHVRLLNGGVGSWQRADRPLSTEAGAPTRGTWSPRATVTDRLATWTDVEARLGGPTAILDTRSAGEFYGDERRAARSGAIPGAVHIEWTLNLDEHGEFRRAADLRRLYESAGITPDREVVTYCQGGYRAAHSYLALRLLGYPRVRNYIGSWKEWGDRPDLPIEQPLRQDTAR